MPAGNGALRGLGGERTPEDGRVGGSIKLTFTGNKRSVVVPSPSWPKLFLPQHVVSPFVKRARMAAI